MVYESHLFWVEPAVFAGFLVISLLFELGVHALEHRLEHKGRHGLIAFLQTLKTELLLYGLLSLLLTMVQPALGHICIEYVKKSVGLEAKAKCETKCSKEGKIEVLPYKTAHKIHVLIFMIAMCHIFVALLSLAICLLKLTRWKQWAAEPKAALVPMDKKVMKNLGKSRCLHLFWSTVMQYSLGVNKAAFLGVRRSFLEQLKEAASLAELLNFPFHKFLVYSAEHHVSHLVTVDWFIWVFAVVLLLLPEGWQKRGLYAMTVGSAAIMVVCGAKMQSALMHLAARAHYLYGHQSVGGEELGSIPEQHLDLEITDQDMMCKTPRPGGIELLKRSASQARKEQRVHQKVKKCKSAKNVFWFSRPTVLLGLYKVAYFQVAFSLAYICYKAFLAKESELLPTDFLDDFAENLQNKLHLHFINGTVFLLVVLGLALLMIIHSAWVVLPVYCLCMTASRESQKYIKDFMETLRSHEWVGKPPAAYLRRELQSEVVVERLDHTASAEAVQGPPTSEGATATATGAAAAAADTTTHGLGQV